VGTALSVGVFAAIVLFMLVFAALAAFPVFVQML
jgi:hypothetical protein